MKQRSVKFSLTVSRGMARLQMDSTAALARLSFAEGSALFRNTTKAAIAALRRRGLAVRPGLDPAHLDPFGFLGGTTGLPVQPATTAGGAKPRLQRKIRLDPICIDCVCTGDGGCKCKVVQCPQKPVA